MFVSKCQLEVLSRLDPTQIKTLLRRHSDEARPRLYMYISKINNINIGGEMRLLSGTATSFSTRYLLIDFVEGFAASIFNYFKRKKTLLHRMESLTRHQMDYFCYYHVITVMAASGSKIPSLSSPRLRPGPLKSPRVQDQPGLQHYLSNICKMLLNVLIRGNISPCIRLKWRFKTLIGKLHLAANV